jgi:hypothetical protein
MFEGTRDTTCTGGSDRFAEGPAVSGSTRQNIRHRHKKHKKFRSTNFAESSGANMVKKKLLGTRRCVEEGISPSLLEPAESRGRDSF